MGKQDGDNILDILVILDRSGSMASGRADHEGGLRSFVTDQQSLPGDVRFTLVQFDSHDTCHIVFDRTPIQDVNPSKIELVPRGGTPLYAAIGRALAHMQARQAKEQSGQTIAMVITDGQDTGPNGEWTKELVQQRRADLEKAGWTFLFLAANMDAFGEAANVGVGQARAMSFQPQGGTTPQAATAAMYGTISNNMAAYRSAGACGMSMSVQSATMDFLKEETDEVQIGSYVTFDGGAAKLASVQQQFTAPVTVPAAADDDEKEKK